MLVHHSAPKLAVGKQIGDDIQISRLFVDTVHRRLPWDRSRVWRGHQAGGTLGTSVGRMVSLVHTLLLFFFFINHG